VRRVRRRNPTAAARGETRRAVRRPPLPRSIHRQPAADARCRGTHRDHAIVEQVIADLKDSALAHLPPGHFDANGAWLVCAAIALDLTRAADALASRFHAGARTATIRTQLINTPARLGPLRPAVHRGLAGPHGVRVGMPRAGRGRLEIPSAWPACVRPAQVRAHGSIGRPPRRSTLPGGDEPRASRLVLVEDGFRRNPISGRG
jgi:hypothetical protein